MQPWPSPQHYFPTQCAPIAFLDGSLPIYQVHIIVYKCLPAVEKRTTGLFDLYDVENYAEK